MIVSVNGAAVLRPHVVPLPIQRGGIVHLPEELEQLPIRSSSRIESHAHDLRMPRAPRADVFIRRRRLAPAHVAHGGLHHPWRLPEASLSPPEAPRCEVARLNHWCIVPYPLPLEGTAPTMHALSVRER